VTLAVALDASAQPHVGGSVDPDPHREPIGDLATGARDPFEDDERMRRHGLPAGERVSEFVVAPVPHLVARILTGQQRGQHLRIEPRPPSGEVDPRHEVVDLDDGGTQHLGDTTRDRRLARPGRTIHADQTDALDGARPRGTRNRLDDHWLLHRPIVPGQASDLCGPLIVKSVEAHEIVVIGAGLAGLRCAARLAHAGHDVVVLEAGDRVGGRQRTDEVDGFLLDRGFQVLNPAYPAVRRWVDVDALRMRPFPVGVRVRREDKVAELRHPLRQPTGLPAILRSGLVSPRDAAAVARWITPALLRPKSVIAGADRTLREGWDRVGLRGALRTEVLEPFLAGVLADDTGATSDSFARLLVRMFAIGRPGVPERGIGALPAQLARTATAAGAAIRLGHRVTGVRARGGKVEIAVDGAESLHARAAVVAVGPGQVADLLDLPKPVTKGLQTWWFSADAAPSASALLSVDGRRRGPVVNTVVMSHAAPSYAPAGRHLIEATCLLAAGAGFAPREAEVRRQLAEVWGAGTAEWQLLRRDDIPDALPSQPPPLRVTSPARCGDGRYVAGDHRDTASIQGALVSGERAARAVLADLDSAGV